MLRTYVTSPIRGQIVTKDLKFLLRSYLDAGVVFADIEDTSSVFVRIAVPESDIGEVAAGAPVNRCGRWPGARPERWVT